MNLAIRGIEANLGDHADDSFHRDLHKDLRADYILANPPFNLDDWYSDALRDDPRWKYGLPPAGNGNFAWVQHFIHHLAPSGMAGFVLANGSLSTKSSGEGEIRRRLVEADLSTASWRMPEKLFLNTASRCASGSSPRIVPKWPFPRSPREVLFIDARKLAGWKRGRCGCLMMADVAGWPRPTTLGVASPPRVPTRTSPAFCRSATIDEIRSTTRP